MTADKISAELYALQTETNFVQVVQCDELN